MVHVQMNGYIADNLFQYSVARLIAEELGFALRVSHSRMHTRRNSRQLREFLSHCRDAPLSLPGAAYEAPVDFSAHMEYGDFEGYELDLDAICAGREPRRIELKGHFQHYRMLSGYKARLREWFAMAPADRGYDIGPEDLVVHVRRGDLVVFGLAMSLRYYTELLERLTFRRLYVCGCGIDHEVKRAFAPHAPIYVEGEPVEDFRFMLAFSRMIQSNSGFSWWAGFLSQAAEIYAPAMSCNTRTDHGKAHRVDLRVDDEARYHYIDDVPYLERDYRLSDVLRSVGQLRKKRVASSLRDLLLRRFGDG